MDLSVRDLLLEWIEEIRLETVLGSCGDGAAWVVGVNLGDEIGKW